MITKMTRMKSLTGKLNRNFIQKSNVSAGGPTYGFAGQKYGVIGRMQSELHDVIDLKDADKTPESGAQNSPDAG